MNLDKNEEKYLVEQIKKTIQSIQHNHYQIIMNEINVGEFHEEYPGWTKRWIQTRIVDLYYLILVYLEGKGMIHLLTTFKSKFQTIIDSKKDIMSSSIQHPEGDPELDIIYAFQQFLDSFKGFDYQQTREDELVKLISILKDTDYIVKNSRAEVFGEADVYKEVKWVLSLYYPTCKGLNKASYPGMFKSYHPDILIPELKVAIEYKYIKSKTDNIDDYLDQIRSDVENYRGDYRFENFIAVIYIENTSLARPESIQEAWKGKRFPNNWTLVVANGSPTKGTSKTKPIKKVP